MSLAAAVLGAGAMWAEAWRKDASGTIAAFAVLAALTAVAALVLRRVLGLVRSLRLQLLFITLGALLLGVVSSLVLARQMVLSASQARTVVEVLAVTAVFTTVLVVVASAPLGRDTRRLEETVRAIERGDRTVRTGVARRDELGHVARALDELTGRLDLLERERLSYEHERTMMLSSVGHDLRTPLAALQAALEAMIDGVAPDPDRYLRSMQKDVTALSALVEDLFLLSRIEAGRLELGRQPLDLTELADEAIEALAPTAARHDVTVRLVAAGSAPVLGDTVAVGRVIRNLIDNAVRHAPPGSVVEVAVTSGAGMPRVSVNDDGPGFPPSFTERAFERFTRAEASRNRTTGGAGLGLAIARGLVEALGGRIWIDGPPGGRVSFELPPAA